MEPTMAGEHYPILLFDIPHKDVEEIYSQLAHRLGLGALQFFVSKLSAHSAIFFFSDLPCRQKATEILSGEKRLRLPPIILDRVHAFCVEASRILAEPIAQRIRTLGILSTIFTAELSSRLVYFVHVDDYPKIQPLKEISLEGTKYNILHPKANTRAHLANEAPQNMGDFNLDPNIFKPLEKKIDFNSIAMESPLEHQNVTPPIKEFEGIALDHRVQSLRKEPAPALVNPKREPRSSPNPEPMQIYPNLGPSPEQYLNPSERPKTFLYAVCGLTSAIIKERASLDDHFSRKGIRLLNFVEVSFLRSVFIEVSSPLENIIKIGRSIQIIEHSPLTLFSPLMGLELFCKISETRNMHDVNSILESLYPGIRVADIKLSHLYGLVIPSFNLNTIRFLLSPKELNEQQFFVIGQRSIGFMLFEVFLVPAQRPRQELNMVLMLEDIRSKFNALNVRVRKNGTYAVALISEAEFTRMSSVTDFNFLGFQFRNASSSNFHSPGGQGINLAHKGVVPSDSPVPSDIARNRNRQEWNAERVPNPQQVVSAGVASHDGCRKLNEQTMKEFAYKRVNDMYDFLNELSAFDLSWDDAAWLRLSSFARKEIQDAWKVQLKQNVDYYTRFLNTLRILVATHNVGIMKAGFYLVGERGRVDISPAEKTVLYARPPSLESHEWKYHEDFYQRYQTNRGVVYVENSDCLATTERLVKHLSGGIVAVMNLANDETPGGGYKRGALAQEEILFRRSNCAQSMDLGWCNPHSTHGGDSHYPWPIQGGCYTPSVCVFRKDEKAGYAFMETPFKCSFVSVAGLRVPVLEHNHLNSYDALLTRRKIETAILMALKNKCTGIVLGALGCGAFRNPPHDVAECFKSVLLQYAHYFSYVIFAIYDDNNASMGSNFAVFRDAFANFRSVNTGYPSVSENYCERGGICSDHSHGHRTAFSHVPLCPMGPNCSQKSTQPHAVLFSHNS